MQYTDNLHDKIRNMKLHYNGNHIQATVSIGVASYTSPDQDLLEIVTSR